ncbi:MAG TPA: MotA/TolQ/ExbB proton channel family protein [Patescibacteria group bacterium]|nr:MotA/TolQ/ExbB proton channel family protein [Patescibacteria group bacterium]
MLSERTLWQMVQAGGFTMYILLICSIFSFTIFLERFIYYRKKAKAKRAEFLEELKKELEKGNTKKASEICQNTDAPFASVASAGIIHSGQNEKAISNAMERAIAIETTKLERYTSIVGTIGSTAVYVGLFGTVLGIIRAFRDISVNRAAGINIVISGISEALICTAAGLLVAVPAVIAYNYFVKKIDNFVTDMELCASEVNDLLTSKQK